MMKKRVNNLVSWYDLIITLGIFFIVFIFGSLSLEFFNEGQIEKSYLFAIYTGLFLLLLIYLEITKLNRK